MKTALLLITVIFFQLSISTALSNNLFSLKDKWKTGHSISANYNELDRDISVIRYWSDAGEPDFVLRQTVLYGDRNNEKSYTDTVIYHKPNRDVYYNEYITHEKDELGRDTSITWIDNEGGGPNYQIRKKVNVKYLYDTRRPVSKSTYTLAGSESYLTKRELWNYDDRGSRTSFITHDYYPGTDEIYQSTGDSVKFEYDSIGRAKKRTMYKFDNLSGNWTTESSHAYGYSGEKLNDVIINQVLEDGTTEIPEYRVSDIEGLNEECEEYEYSEAALFILSIFSDGEWQPSEKNENIYENGARTNIKSLWSGSNFLPRDKTESKNFHGQVYNSIKNILTWIPRESLTDISKSAFFEDTGDFELISASRNLMQLSVNVPFSKSGIYDATEEDSLMTLIHQVYDPGTDEWYDQGNKFEVVFRNISTSVKDEFAGENNVVIYPNPTDGFVNIQINDIKKMSRIDIVNTSGQTVSTTHFENFSGNHWYKTDLKHLEKGMYFIKVHSDSKVVSKKFILF